jgi:hypothetical protein
MQSPLPPSCARSYEPVRVLASGAHGVVYLARHRELGREAAIKLLHALDDEGAARFRDEALLTARVQHPHVVKILDHGIDGGVPWIAFEYVAGPTLRARVAAGPLPWPDALRAAREIASALAAAHAAGVVHRDVKPDNVLAGPAGAKLTDFGIAKWSGSLVKTGTGVVLGTLGYLAPELAQGGPPSPASDVYALGVTLFELLAGAPPFASPNVLDLIEMHRAAPVPPVSARRPGVPRAVDGLLARMLEKRPERRPGAAQVAEELAALEALPAGRVRSGRGVVPLAASASLVVALLLGGLAAAVRERPERVEPLTTVSASAAPPPRGEAPEVVGWSRELERLAQESEMLGTEGVTAQVAFAKDMVVGGLDFDAAEKAAGRLEERLVACEGRIAELERVRAATYPEPPARVAVLRARIAGLRIQHFNRLEWVRRLKAGVRVMRERGIESGAGAFEASAPPLGRGVLELLRTYAGALGQASGALGREPDAFDPEAVRMVYELHEVMRAVRYRGPHYSEKLPSLASLFSAAMAGRTGPLPAALRELVQELVEATGGRPEQVRQGGVFHRMRRIVADLEQAEPRARAGIGPLRILIGTLEDRLIAHPTGP